MTQLLATVIEKLTALPEDEQEAIAADILRQLESDQKWDTLFSETTDAQWDAMIAEVEHEIEAGETEPLEKLISAK